MRARNAFLMWMTLLLLPLLALAQGVPLSEPRTPRSQWGAEGGGWMLLLVVAILAITVWGMSRYRKKPPVSP